jgi:hypothetical protein
VAQSSTVYDDVVNEDVPDDFLSLLAKADKMKAHHASRNPEMSSAVSTYDPDDKTQRPLLDEICFVKAYEEIQSLTFRRFSRSFLQQCSADDVAQDAMLKAVRSPRKVQARI